MKFYSLKCPQCGSNLDVNLDRDFFFCQFCGAKIMTDSISKNELRIKEMEHEEKMKKHDVKEKESKWDSIETIIMYTILGLFVVFGFLYMFTH